MNRIILFILLLFSAMLSIQSCSKEKGSLPVPVVSDCDTINPLTYSNFVSPLLTTNCNFGGCHAAGSSNGDYTSYAGVKQKVDNGSFRDRVLVKKDMPSSLTTGPKTLSSCDLKKLDKWLKNGAPQ